MPKNVRFLRVALAIGMVLLTARGFAAQPRVLPEGKLPDDRRLGPLKDLNGYFPFVPQKSPTEWSKRAAALRRQVLLANGLWPMPTKAPANAVVHGKVDREDYTVEKVYFESYPGHFVTGSLYRPKGRSGKLPGVLCPHGHWPNGRFHDHGQAKVEKELQSGAEKFLVSGRHPLQARCVQLARMGCVVFHYDMIGYADSAQIAHRPGVRPHLSKSQDWGFFSPQAELRLQTMMGLQTYNSVRALDWLLTLPDIDPARIAVTGASGGGTQTFVLCAIDPRPAVAFPAVMVSTAMQGGCTCENASYLRVETGNVELAALFAPKPLGMTAANDWTRDIESKGLPELKQHYALLGVPDLVMAKYLPFEHNYNQVSRTLMYGWFNQHLKLGYSEPIEERAFVPLTVEELSVWDAGHPRPPSGDQYEISLLRTMTQDSTRQIAALEPTDAESLARYREVVGGAWETMLGRPLPAGGALEFERSAEIDRGKYLQIAGLLQYKAQGESLPIVFLHPKTWNKQVVVWLSEAGKSGLFTSSGDLAGPIARLVDAGSAVAGVDLLYQGEFLPDGQPLKAARLVASGRDTWASYAGYTFGYNHAVFAQRVHDILSVLAFVRNHESKPERIHLAGLDTTGPLAAAAATVSGDTLDRLAVGTAGFRFAQLTAIDDPNFLPGAVKYGDVPALLNLASAKELLVAGESDDVIKQLQKIDALRKVKTTSADSQQPDKTTLAIDWLLK